MDNFDSSKVPGNENLDEPIPFGEDLDKPIPFDDTSVSHSPLTLGGSGAVEAAPKLARPVEKKPEEKIVSTDQITGVKTFFTKLHPGAIEFLDEQIGKWLKKNPGVTIKRTNVTTGEVQAKKTEPNIIITIWY